MSQMGVVVWKELRETLLRRGRPSWPVVGMIGAAFFIAVLLPVLISVMAEPADRLTVLAFLTFFVPVAEPFIAFFSVGYVIVDAVAGERERNTLQTLLSTPLSNRDILLGKLIPVLLLPVANLLLLNVLAFVTLSILYGHHYDPPFLLMGLALGVGVLVALLAAAFGALISITSGSVRQGQQLLGYLMLPLPVLFLLPNLRIGLMENLVGFAPLPVVVLVYAMAYVGLLVGLYALAFRLFTRDRLMRV